MSPRVEMSSRTVQFIASILKQSPDPPRQVSFTSLLLSILTTSSTWIVLMFGLLCVLMAAYLTSLWMRSGEAVGIYTIVPFIFIVGVLGLVAPARGALAFYAALRRGSLAKATVENVTFQADTNATFAAMMNGLARGTRRIHNAGRSFQEEFEIDEPFAKEIKVGTTLLVLLDPHGKRSAIELGLEE